MKSLFFLISAVISLLIILLTVLHIFTLRRKKSYADRIFSTVQSLTLGVFVAVAIVFVPIYYTSYDLGDRYSIIRPLLLSLHNTLRIFILDGDFDIIRAAVADLPVTLRVCFSFYVAILYVAAPILTFSNVLSLFKDIKDELRLKLHNSKPLFIMSQLNNESVALANSIRRDNKNAVIVFTGIVYDSDDGEYELMQEAKEINAICLRKDITKLKFDNKKANTEIFLIGDCESENTAKAVNIVTALNRKNTKHNVKVFVFSKNEADARILDSLSYDNLMAYAVDKNFDNSTFKLRRINEVHQLVWATVPSMKVFDIANKHNNTLSVLIAGLGSYGTEFFRTLVWYCQFEGYKLELTLADNSSESYMKSYIRRLCPDLLKTANSTVDGESCYDISFLPEVDMTTADIDDILLYSGDDKEKLSVSEKLKRTNLCIVSLDNDNINIETSVHLRRLFDRVHRFKAKSNITCSDENVQIYSVIRSPESCSVLGCENESSQYQLTDHKGIPYNIHFIGDINSRYDYKNIYNQKLESDAYEYHIGWVAIEEQIFNEWTAKGDIENLKNHDWYFEGENTEKAKSKARENYEKYEYFRNSSIAKALYRREVFTNPLLAPLITCRKEEKLQSCECVHCLKRKRSEHMRWNAYIRSVGYAYQDGMRADRALLHDNLCGWDGLTKLEQDKD